MIIHELSFGISFFMSLLSFWIYLPSLMPMKYPMCVFVTQKDSLHLNVETHNKAHSFNGHQNQSLFPHGFISTHYIALPTLLHTKKPTKQQHNNIYNNNINSVLFIKFPIFPHSLYYFKFFYASKMKNIHMHQF